MRNALIILLLVVLPGCAQEHRTFTVSGNFPRDQYGAVDDRLPGVSCNVGPCIWGRAAADSLPIRFSPPAGYRVRILKLRGDLIAWPKVLDGQPAVSPSAYAGVLLGFSTTGAEGSTKCDFCADNTPLYVQGAIHGGAAIRVPYSYDYRDERVILGDDNVLVLKLASFLSTIPYPLHLEGTYTISFEFEPSIRSGRSAVIFPSGEHDR